MILSHGYNGKGSDFCKEAAFFAEHGIVACTFDFCGGSVHSDSSMDTRRMSVLTEKEDLDEMISFVKAHREVAAGQLFLLGGSQGGFVTTLAAAERPDGIRGLILYYPAFCIPDDWRKEYPDPSKIPESREFWGMELGKAYFSAVFCDGCLCSTWKHRAESSVAARG
ncbi:MAG: alpha/beta hydrolase family protein [Lachnospiraceae bacterium]